MRTTSENLLGNEPVRDLIDTLWREGRSTSYIQGAVNKALKRGAGSEDIRGRSVSHARIKRVVLELEQRRRSLFQPLAPRAPRKVLRRSSRGVDGHVLIIDLAFVPFLAGTSRMGIARLYNYKEVFV
jgi:hypothetical protein